MKRRRGLLDGAAAWINKGHWSEVRRLITWLRGWSEDRRAPVALGLHTIVWMALDDIWAQSLDGSNLSEEERRRIWDEAAVPLLTALHVKGFDPPLPALLAQGRAAMDQ